MTTTLSINTTEQDPEAVDLLKRTLNLIDELRSIEGLRVVVTGDLQVKIDVEPPEELCACHSPGIPLGARHQEAVRKSNPALSELEQRALWGDK